MSDTLQPSYDVDGITVYAGDCLTVLAQLGDASVDAVVTDPPYDLTSGKRGGSVAASVNLDSPYGRSRIGTGNGSGGFMGKAWDSTGVAFDPTTWVEVLRVLKPGGHLLAFGGTRTWHRLACAVEDAGFEVRDSIAWLYGSGFPKSLDVSKAIDKAAGAERVIAGPRVRVDGKAPGVISGGKSGAYGDLGVLPTTVTAPATDDARTWQGWGTALKPAFEPIVVARKPLLGTVAGNVLAHGTGALNVDGCRIEHASDADLAVSLAKNPGRDDTVSSGVYGAGRPQQRVNIAGRWPANVVLDESQAAELDQQSGELHTQKSRTSSGRGTNGGMFGVTSSEHNTAYLGEVGGAARFFYTAKAGTDERVRINGTAHPTVKPLSLMRWLVRLVTPPGGVVLEPFAGSGTTVEACLLEGFGCVAIEREPEYLPLIRQRIDRRRDPVAAIRAAGAHTGLDDTSDELGLFGLLDEGV